MFYACLAGVSSIPPRSCVPGLVIIAKLAKDIFLFCNQMYRYGILPVGPAEPVASSSHRHILLRYLCSSTLSFHLQLGYPSALRAFRRNICMCCISPGYMI